jgi:hypothetical protein
VAIKEAATVIWCEQSTTLRAVLRRLASEYGGGIASRFQTVCEPMPVGVCWLAVVFSLEMLCGRVLFMSWIRTLWKRARKDTLEAATAEMEAIEGRFSRKLWRQRDEHRGEQVKGIFDPMQMQIGQPQFAGALEQGTSAAYQRDTAGDAQEQMLKEKEKANMVAKESLRALEAIKRGLPSVKGATQ